MKYENSKINMDTIDTIISILNFYKGEFTEDFDKFDMLSISLGKVSDIDTARTSISDQGSEEDRGKEYHLYEAKVYFTHPVDWIELGERRYNRRLGIDIIYLDVEDKDPEDLARMLFRFEKPTGLQYAL